MFRKILAWIGVVVSALVTLQLVTSYRWPRIYLIPALALLVVSIFGVLNANKEEKKKPRKKLDKSKIIRVIATVGVVLSAVMMIIINCTYAIPRGFLIPVIAVFIISLIGMLRTDKNKAKVKKVKEETEQVDETIEEETEQVSEVIEEEPKVTTKKSKKSSRKIDWKKIVSIVLVAVLAISTVVVGVLFGWLCLLPLVLLGGEVSWLLKVVIKKKSTIPAIVLITMSAILTVAIGVLFGWLCLLPLVLLGGAVSWLLKVVIKKKSTIPAIVLTTMFAILTVVIGVLFGWWCLLPFIFLCMAVSWLLSLMFNKESAKRKYVSIPVAAMIIAILLFGVYLIVATTSGINGKVDTLEADKVIVKDGLVIEDGDLDLDKGDVNIKDGDLNIDKGDTNIKDGDLNIDKGDVNIKDGDLNVDGDANIGGDLNVDGDVNEDPTPSEPTPSEPTPSDPTPSEPTPSEPTPSEPTPSEPVVTPMIKSASLIRYGETLYVDLEGIDASNLLVSNKRFVTVEKVSNSRVAITLTEDVDGYITITDSVSRVNVVIDIVA